METKERIRPGRRNVLPIDSPELPNQLRRYRIERGMTLQQIANYLTARLGRSFSRQAVHKAEMISSAHLHRYAWYALADLFNVDPRHLENRLENNQKNFTETST